MRIALLADIHANRAALETVAQQVEDRRPDVVVVAGDIINRGPLPRFCLEFILQKRDREGWLVLKGNHEDFVLWEDQPDRRRENWEVALHGHSAWTHRQIRDLLPAVRSLPDRADLRAPDGGELRFVHGSMQGNRVGIYRRTSDDDLAALIAPPPALLGIGHTHVPMVRDLGKTRIVNCGAVGLPFDGIHGASYAWLEWRDGAWDANIVRLPYDRAGTEEAFLSTGYIEDGGDAVPLILEELRQALPFLGPWHRRYEARVASGELALADSVELLLEESRNGGAEERRASLERMRVA